MKLIHKHGMNSNCNVISAGGIGVRMGGGCRGCRCVRLWLAVETSTKSQKPWVFRFCATVTAATYKVVTTVNGGPPVPIGGIKYSYSA